MSYFGCSPASRAKLLATPSPREDVWPGRSARAPGLPLHRECGGQERATPRGQPLAVPPADQDALLSLRLQSGLQTLQTLPQKTPWKTTSFFLEAVARPLLLHPLLLHPLLLYPPLLLLLLPHCRC